MKNYIARHAYAGMHWIGLHGQGGGMAKGLWEKALPLVGGIGQGEDMEGAMLRALSEVMSMRDSGTESHNSRTAKYIHVMLDAMRAGGVYERALADCDVGRMLSGALLHDIGKIAISDAILNKPGQLTESEFGMMRQHAVIGMGIIGRIGGGAASPGFLDCAKTFALTHHEKWDGSGYPYGLSGESIPLAGRVMAIADVYDALVSRRPYKDPMPAGEAAMAIVDGSGRHFDPALVDAFVRAEKGFRAIADGMAPRAA